MPIRLPRHFPAIAQLKREHLDVEANDAKSRGPMAMVKLAVLNLMPMKLTTEADLVRLLSALPLDIEVTWMKLRSHTPRHTSAEHMERYYRYFDQLKDEPFDGLIVTGAPVEHLSFEEVDYWPELSAIFSWAVDHVRSALYICWAAQAGLYYHYGIPKYPLNKKMFGIFPQVALQPQLPLFRGFDDVFSMPHSRHTEIRREDILACGALTVIAESPESGVSMVMARQGREFFITGHLEYAPNTLDEEYHRDMGKRTDVEMPRHYYRDGDPAKGPLVTWRAHAHLLFMNWVSYYVH